MRLTDSLPACLICLLFLPSIFCLTCYECQERRAGDWCLSPSRQKCKSENSICLKYLHKEGKQGFTNHVLAKCELRSYYRQNRINACERSVKKLNDGAVTITEICTCDTDLCNGPSLTVTNMVEAAGAEEQKEKGQEQEQEEQQEVTTEKPEEQPGESYEYDTEGDPGSDQAVESSQPEEQQSEGDGDGEGEGKGEEEGDGGSTDSSSPSTSGNIARSCSTTVIAVATTAAFILGFVAAR